ncbi:MAG: hypothetical protein IPG04_31705 [Polyangiaceae bacterium]|nr:hypothetical protein [Polyangiaceae bacterium]
MRAAADDTTAATCTTNSYSALVGTITPSATNVPTENAPMRSPPSRSIGTVIIVRLPKNSTCS